jgi:hypothetical protein
MGFVNKGNRQKAHLIVGENTFSGTYNDFRFFEIESNSWNYLRLESLKDSVRIYLNDNSSYIKPVKTDMGEFCGFVFHSYDTLMFDYIHLFNLKKDSIYCVDF